MTGRAQQARFQLAAPLVRTDRLLFERRHEVTFELGLPGVAIRVTTDGSTPGPESPILDGPLVLTDHATVKARAFHVDWAPSEVVARRFYRVRAPVRHVELLSEPSASYPGRGAETLRDIRGGSASFGDGSWLGYQDDDLLATLDLGVPTAFVAVLVSTLAANGSWIFLPAAVLVETSHDGVVFTEVASRDYAPPAEPEADGQHFFRLEAGVEGAEATARYVRVTVRRRGPLPEWHAAAGSPAWLFVDALAVI